MNKYQSIPDTGYLPVYQTIRNQSVESIHFGAIAVVDPQGSLYAWYGNPQAKTYLRSSAKPFQTLPLIEMGGVDEFKMSEAELAITCASHSGTDIHIKTVFELQQKIGISEDDLQCGTHQPLDKAAQSLLRDRGEQPSFNHHNCSGKHTGMLGQAVLMGTDLKEYTEIDHPVQTKILSTVCEICSINDDQIQIGRDGCSVPTYCMPLFHAAWGWARLESVDKLPPNKQIACQQVTESMLAEPFMVAGPGRLDTKIMEVGDGTIISKAGAEAYQAAVIKKNSLYPGSPTLGIALKISDGDQRNQVRRSVFIETLRQLEFFSKDHHKLFSSFGPELPILNQRDIEVGIGKPCFQLQYS